MITVAAGLAAGALHVVSGPDHLAALAPLAVDDRRRATLLGFRWGLGHGLGAVLLGLLGIAARGAVDIHAWSGVAELVVGFTLIAVGSWSLWRAQGLVVHAHPHDHADPEASGHQHVHVHEHAATHRPEDHRAHTHAAFAVGMLHGAAGTGHLLAVLPAMALEAPLAVVYLAAYFVAAVAAMTAFAGALGRLLAGASGAPVRYAMQVTAAAALGIGGWWIVSAWPV